MPARKPLDAVPVTVNRAPVLTLWAAVVAERLGHDPDAALTLGRAVAGMNAAAKARTLGITRPHGAEPGEAKRRGRAAPGRTVLLLGREVPVVETPEGLRAAHEGRADNPAAVQRYLEGKFGERLKEVRASMQRLARSVPRAELEASAFALYEQFRPGVPRGTRGWGAKGVLDLEVIERLCARGSRG